MHRSRLVNGLAAAFGLMTAVFVVGGLVGSPALFLFAALFGAMTYVLRAHASGRLMGRVYRGVEDRARPEGGFGAGPREEWTPPRDGRTAAEARRRAREQAGRRRADGRGPRGARQRTRDPAATERLTAEEAYERLGVEPGSDGATVKRAYRERIKEVHPDAENGDAEAFKRVQDAYDRLTE